MRLPNSSVGCPVLAFVAVLAIAVCAADSRAGESEERMAKAAGGQQLRYLLIQPEEGEEKPADGWPLVLFLHGSGERGDDLARVKVHGPPKLAGKIEALAGSVIVAPQCPSEKWWQTETLKALVDEVLAGAPEVDRKRLYITGLSMGGYGTWSFISEHPEYFAAAAPVCGGGDPNLLAILEGGDYPFSYSAEKLARARDLPVWAFHGDADPVVPVSESKALVEVLEKAGSRKAKLTLYPGVGHDSWSKTYEDPEFYRWLMAQRRE